MALLPNDDQCRRVIDLLEEEPELNSFESDFVESNIKTLFFTSKQKEVIRQLMEKYECS